jgi:energy-coupling factor transporter transmembrane protein EcfT
MHGGLKPCCWFLACYMKFHVEQKRKSSIHRYNSILLALFSIHVCCVLPVFTGVWAVLFNCVAPLLIAYACLLASLRYARLFRLLLVAGFARFVTVLCSLASALGLGRPGGLSATNPRTSCCGFFASIPDALYICRNAWTNLQTWSFYF